ncbi:nicotinamide N-methyltransferase-like [Pelobates cultripes]|uniref:Nicotinamide N-methyltransferase-like n=1 Tax=Pelobates cultripes TaxID=61616 RepID=A0AAD1T6V2_PELCU|nr:nicotinamide N-methyltransferase-like [Pelobates cultripes]
MSSTSYKHYHDKNYPAKRFVEIYFCDDRNPLIEESMEFPLEQIHKDIDSGLVKGETLIDFSMGATATHLIPVCSGFKDIYVVEVNKVNIDEFEKWRQSKEDAVHFSYGAKVHHKLEGGREAWHLKEDKIRQAIKGVIQWDISNDDQVPVDLPQADCVLSVYLLNVISKDKEAFQRNMKKITSRLKIGGSLLLIFVINMTFYEVDDHKFFVLKVDEDFIKHSVINAGFVLENVNVLPRQKNTKLVDHDAVMYVRGRKEREA